MRSYISDLRRDAKRRNKEEIRVYNFDTKDFKFKFDDKEYTLKATDVTVLPYPIAMHGAKHLVTHLFNIDKQVPTDKMRKKKMDEVLLVGK